ncbi:MAG: hypothetical protein HN601_01900 [Candidatus Marinimicrobia bacterium]|nr:hypothetical protein [Candidatus Neomarinimicrobiota bacterium]
MAKITPSPLPKFKDILSSIFSPLKTDEELLSPWSHSGDNALLMSSSTWSLLLLVRWYKNAYNLNNITILVPDFFCNTALCLLRDEKINIVFYPLKDDMYPDIEACKNIAKEQSINLFILVHYFGSPRLNMDTILFCKENSSLLVEDATHVLRSIPGVGEVGDVVLYSLHKHFPMPDGAIFILRNKGVNKISKNMLMPLIEAKNSIIEESSSTSLEALLWLMKRIIQNLGIRFPSQKKIFMESYYLNNSIYKKQPKMSSLGKHLLGKYILSIDKISLIRKKNTNLWQQVFESSEIKMSSQSIQSLDKATPYLASYKVKNVNDTEALFYYLQDLDFPVSTWPDLPPEVKKYKDIHSAAIKRRHHYLYLPVHQSITALQIQKSEERMVEITSHQWGISVLNKKEWESHWNVCSSKNLFQSWDHGTSIVNLTNWKVQRFLISNQNDLPIALIQVVVRIIPIIGGIAYFNRGPLLLLDCPIDREVALKLISIRVLMHEARRQRWRIIQGSPELPQTSQAEAGMKALKFKLLSNSKATLTHMWFNMDKIESSIDGFQRDANLKPYLLAGKWRRYVL